MSNMITTKELAARIQTKTGKTIKQLMAKSKKNVDVDGCFLKILVEAGLSVFYVDNANYHGGSSNGGGRGFYASARTCGLLSHTVKIA